MRLSYSAARNWLLSLWMAGGGLTVAAQVAFDHLTTADGLSQSTVWEITQDRNGFIWMATADGLNRYDGSTFTTFRHQPDRANSLPTNDISTLYADRRGNLWVAPRAGGVHRLRDDGQTFEHFPKTTRGQNIAGVHVGCLAEIAGYLWVGTSGVGLLAYDFRTNQLSHWPDERIGTTVTALMAEGDHLWLATEPGQLLRLNPRTGHLQAFRVPSEPGMADRHRTIAVIHRDNRGRLWVGTSGQGLYRFDEATGAFVSQFFRRGVYETVNLITDVLDAPTGDLWVLTDYGALRYPNGDVTRPALILPDPANDRSLSTHALKKGFRDKDGNLWFGTWQGGVNILRPRREPFAAFRHQPFNPQSLLVVNAAPLTADRLGQLWVGSNQGLTRISADGTRFRHFNTRNSSLRADDINPLFVSPSGKLYVSTWTAGFCVSDPRTERFTPVALAGRSKSAKSFAAADTGRVWVSTQERELFLFDEKKGQLQPIDLSPVAQASAVFSFNALVQDARGTLWIGTYNTGLLAWNRRANTVRLFTADGKPGSLGSNSIVSLYEDRQKRLWVGTNGGGLHRYDPATDRFRAVTTRDGLANNYIAGILEDTQGTLWLSTNGGISSYNPATGAIHNYDQRDGLVGKEFLQNASAALPDGRLAFGSTQGLVVFQPERLKEKMPPPRVYLTGLKLFNRPVSPTDRYAPTRLSLTDAPSLVFRPDQSVFTLEFTGVSFHPNRNIRYQYRLDGFDEDWNDVGSQTAATYTNLPEGDYTFRVRAAIGNSAWSAPRTVQIEVLPPWYRRWYTYLLYGLTILGLLYALRRIIRIRERLKADVRVKQIERDTIQALDDAKTSFFTNISHEFRTPLTLILAPLEKLTQEENFGERLQHQFQTIQRNAQRLLRLVNQLLDLSKLESGSLVPDVSRHDVVRFTERIVSSFGELAESKRVSLRFKANFDSFEGFFDPDILEKITYNLLSNAFRFTPDGGEVRVSLTVEPGEPTCTLTVADTGVGIPDEAIGHIFERFYQADGQQTRKKSGTGVGLALTRELVELHRGTIDVESAVHVGTTFTVTLPLGEAAFPPAWLAHEAEPVEAVPSLLPTFVPEGLAIVPPRGLGVPVLLLVEDNEELRLYLKEYFARSYHVLTAPDGKAALALAARHIPDLVISDWLMPEMDGAELCFALKQDEKTSHVPFLLLTSRSSNQSQLNAFESGIDDYMTKPFNLAILETKVRSLIQNRQRLREKWSRHRLAQPSDVQLPPMEEQFIQKAVAVIETHLDDPHFDAEGLETALNLSRMQLYRKLKSITNASATEFIRQVRLQRAAQLLQSGHFNVSEVAYRVGFNDPAYFSRCFRKEFGKAPQEWLGRVGSVR